MAHTAHVQAYDLLQLSMLKFKIFANLQFYKIE